MPTYVGLALVVQQLGYEERSLTYVDVSKLLTHSDCDAGRKWFKKRRGARSGWRGI